MNASGMMASSEANEPQSKPQSADDGFDKQEDDISKFTIGYTIVVEIITGIISNYAKHYEYGLYLSTTLPILLIVPILFLGDIEYYNTIEALVIFAYSLIRNCPNPFTGNDSWAVALIDTLIQLLLTGGSVMFILIRRIEDKKYAFHERILLMTMLSMFLVPQNPWREDTFLLNLGMIIMLWNLVWVERGIDKSIEISSMKSLFYTLPVLRLQQNPAIMYTACLLAWRVLQIYEFMSERTRKVFESDVKPEQRTMPYLEPDLEKKTRELSLDVESSDEDIEIQRKVKRPPTPLPVKKTESRSSKEAKTAPKFKKNNLYINTTKATLVGPSQMAPRFTESEFQFSIGPGADEEYESSNNTTRQLQQQNAVQNPKNQRILFSGYATSNSSKQ